MSYVTDVVLFFSSLEDAPARVNEIDRFFRSGAGRHFAPLDRHAAGSKAMHASVWGGAFNYLGNIDHLLGHLRHNVQWEFPDDVQVWYKQENADRGTFVCLADLA